MNYLQIEFETLNEDECEILVALLAEAGFESFEEEEKSLKAFIKEEGFEEDSLEPVLQVVPVNYAITVVPQQNWNAQWESSFEPIIVNDLVLRTPWAGIRAGFHQHLKDVQYEIIITPKMSFGTGHHATTYMMIEQMQRIDFTDKTVVDFGTGTAVLAILAEKMGAAAIDAIDYDEWSIENSGENAAANGCSKINLILAETISTGKIYDIILANINLHVIISNLPAIKAAGKKGTLILFSGFIKADEAVISAALVEFDMRKIKSIQKGEWISMLAEIN